MSASSIGSVNDAAFPAIIADTASVGAPSQNSAIEGTVLEMGSASRTRTTQRIDIRALGLMSMPVVGTVAIMQGCAAGAASLPIVSTTGFDAPSGASAGFIILHDISGDQMLSAVEIFSALMQDRPAVRGELRRAADAASAVEDAGIRRSAARIITALAENAALIPSDADIEVYTTDRGRVMVEIIVDRRRLAFRLTESHSTSRYLVIDGLRSEQGELKFDDIGRLLGWL